MTSTADILNHHLESFSNGDMEGILSDYTDTSLLFTPQGTLQGPEQIRPLFQSMFNEFGQEGCTFTMLHQDVQGDTAYIVWEAETPNNVYELATDTFIVRDGKITSQTFAGKITPKA
jgi:ketosteroid isomerase-like protein